MQSNIGFIYQIINLKNGKFYIGSTINTTSRWRTHLRKLRANTHHCSHLQASWTKHGESAFSFNTIKSCPVDQLNALEQELLDKHHGTKSCYNTAKYVDNSNRGIVLQEKHRTAISKSLKNFYANTTAPNLGRKHTEESKLLMSQNRRGKPMSEETKQKIREANLGKTYGEETRRKLSEIRKKTPKTKEHVAKYNKQIIDISTGQIYPSLKEVKRVFGMSPGFLSKALSVDRPLQKGKNAGRHFRYLDSPANL